jgi:hypothetical protein
VVLRAIVLVATAASLLSTASPAGAGTLDECAQRVIRDWFSEGRVDRLYPLRCYHAAIRALPADVLQYTDAGHDIERALAQARQGRTHPPVARSADRPSEHRAPDRASPPAGPALPLRDRLQGLEQPPRDTVRVASGPHQTTGGPSIPYPLIVLGALGPVLLVSGLAGALARRRR